MTAWRPVLAALVAVRAAIPLAVLAAEGSALPGLPRYDFAPLRGDASGYYAAAREFMASWGRLPVLVLLGLVVGALAAGGALAMAWRRAPRARGSLVAAAAAAVSVAASAAVLEMNPSGAPVVGWPLVWAAPMLPWRALGAPLDPDIGFAFGLALSLALNGVAVVATAYAGLYATGRRAVGLGAAALFALWPVLMGLIAGERAWENGTWTTDAGLALYTEPLSTALVAVSLALLLRPRLEPVAVALAGAALGFATVVKLSNAIVAAAGLALVLWRGDVRRSLVYAAAGLAWVPLLAAFWPLGYSEQFERGLNRPPDLFALHHAGASWTESLLWTPRTLAIVLPLAVVGGWALRRHPYALAALLAWTLANPLLYAFYYYTAQHPRFLFAGLPSLFVLIGAGAAAVARLVTSAGSP